jgi:hypothetical protein
MAACAALVVHGRLSGQLFAGWSGGDSSAIAGTGMYDCMAQRIFAI